MKKCLKCDIVFQLRTRVRCLYCNSLLMTAGEGEGGGYEGIDVEEIFEEQVQNNRVSTERIDEEGLTDEERRMRKGDLLIEQMINNREQSGLGRMQYIMSSYFRSRTLGFVYYFYKKEYLLGKVFKRFWIQPMNITSFLLVPWMCINFLDSLLIRVTHNGYCKKCDCKFVKKAKDAPHKQKECEYNKEFSSIVIDIFTGKITQEELAIQQNSLKKRMKGERSAYFDLCASESKFSSVLDIISIWISIAFWLHLSVNILFPVILKMGWGIDLGIQLR